MDFCFLKQSHLTANTSAIWQLAPHTTNLPLQKTKTIQKLLSLEKSCFIFFFNILESRQENGLIGKEENGKSKITWQNNTCGSKRGTKWQSWDSRRETSGLPTSLGSRAGHKPKMQNYILNIHTRTELICFSQLSPPLSLFLFCFDLCSS